MIDEVEYDLVLGAFKSKKKMSILNKKKLSSQEMDELFGGIYD